MPPKSRVSSADISEQRCASPSGGPPPGYVGVDWESVRSRALEQVQANLECRRIVDAILLDVDDEIVRMHVDHMTVPWAVQSLMTDLYESIHLAFAEREDDLDETWDDPQHADVLEDLSEPLPIPADPWCRGAMQKRKPIPLPQLTSSVNANNSPASTAAAAALARSIAAAAASTGRAKRDIVKPVNPVLNNSFQELFERPSSAASSRSHATAPVQRTPQLQNLSKLGSRPASKESGRSSALDSHRSSEVTAPAPTSKGGKDGKGGGSQANTLNSNPGGNRTPQGAAYTDEELQILKKQKETLQRMSQLRRIADKVEHQLNEVRGHSSFIVDGATNTVIAVHPIDPATLPVRQEPKIVVEKPEKADKHRSLQTPDVSSIGRSGTPGLNDSKRAQSPAQLLLLQQQLAAAHKKTDVTVFYTQEAQVQPMIQDLAPAAGVASKEGETVKRAELKLPKSRMTKSEFTKLIQSQSSVAAAMAQQQQQAAGGADGGSTTRPASGADAPVSPPLTSVRRKSLAKERTASANESAATPPPLMQHVVSTHDTSTSLDHLPPRALTPQPTAVRPVVVMHGSPSRESPSRVTSAARSAAARSLCAQLQKTAAGNASIVLRTSAKVIARKSSDFEDETAREFVSTLHDMGDFEPMMETSDE